MKSIENLINRFRQQSLKKLKTHKAMGYFCLYVPPEIIEAYGFIPVRLAGMGSGQAENEGEKFIHNEACSFCKECLGLKSLKQLPHDGVDYVVIPSPCDQMKRHGEKWHLDFGVPTYHLFVPATWEDASCQDIYWQEIKWLAEELKAIKVRERSLQTIVDQYNEARQRLICLSSRLNYEDLFNLTHLFFISPVSEFLHYLDQIEEHVTSESVVSSERIRLMLVGSPIGYGDNFIQQILEPHRDIQIVYDATCTGQRSFDINIPLGGNSIANIATTYFSRPPCVWRRPNNQFYQYIQELISKYQVHGIIYKTLKFCDLWKFELKRFKDWAECPVLGVETTYSPAQDAQIEKRISAFLDMFK